MQDVAELFAVATLDAAFGIKSNRHSKFNKGKKRADWDEKPRSAATPRSPRRRGC